jgi:replicative DNA helicase
VTATGEAPPADTTDPVITAERQLLGALLLRPAALNELSLDPARFYRPAHSLIAAALVRMHARHEGIDPVTVDAALGKAGAKVPPRYLHDLVAGCVTAANTTWQWQVVTDAWARRHTTETLHATAARITTDTATDPLGEITRAQGTLAGLVADLTHAGDLTGFDHGIDDVLSTLTDPSAARRTGWGDLDAMIRGWRPGALYVVAARPGNGKSIVALNSALRVAVDTPVLFHNLEMSRAELQERALSAWSGVGHERFHTGADPTAREWAKLHEARERLAGMTLVVDDRPGVGVADVAARARSVIDRHGSLGLVVIDYLQLVTPARSGRRDENRQEQVAAMTRSLKLLAKELRVPVLLCAQLNRQGDSRADSRPRLSDLRESGAIEQDADVVMLLHREVDVDPQQENPRAGELELAVAKNRHGPTGVVRLAWRAHVSRVDPIAHA